MSADSLDDFPYKSASGSSSEEERRRYWAVAIGLQAVDGLEVSPYLRGVAGQYIKCEKSLQETGRLIRSYHSDSANDSTKEADLVSQHIAALLADGAFALVPDFLTYIHRELFSDLDDSVYAPGQFKVERLVKQEEILNGDSVLYADPSMIQMSLDYLFREERGRDYNALIAGEDLTSFARFISLIWQVHPFAEGNTRTVAVFSELYLRHLGFAVNNEPFEKHARYFRDALVRANYRNPQAGISPEAKFIRCFYDNVINAVGHELNREQLPCPQLFDNPNLLKNIPIEEALNK